MIRFLALFAAMVLARSAVGAETRLAVIALPQSGAEDLADLVQLRLGQHKDVALVERASIKDILREQELQSAMAADSPGKRVVLGRLLKADTLVLLAGREKPQPHLELVVCETQQGLRLCVQPLTRSTSADAGADAVLKLVQSALDKQRQKISDICAVLPLVNSSLTREMDHFQGAYAQLIEQLLLERPGVMVVELSEAKAIAEEILSSSSPRTERRLPLYVVGEFRVDGTGEKCRGQFTLRLKRGEVELSVRQAGDLTVTQLPDRLRQAANEMLDKALGQTAKPPDAAAEVRQLTQRAAAFAAIGSWPETVALAEAGLLLAPDSVELHGHALMGLNKMAEELLPFDNRCKSPEDRILALRYMRAALPHMEAYLRETKLHIPEHSWCLSPWNRLPSALEQSSADEWYPRGVDAVEHRRLCLELWRELMPVANRVLAAKAAERVEDHSLNVLGRLTEPPGQLPPNPTDLRFSNESCFGVDGQVSSICKHRLALLEKFTYLTEHQTVLGFFTHLVSPPWGRPNEPAYQDFLTNVEKLPNEGMREAARRVREFYTRGPDWTPQYAGPTPPPASMVPDAEVVLRPIQLTVVGPDGKESPFDKRDALYGWLKTADGIDAVLATQSIFLMKQKGRLIRLPLAVCNSRLFGGMNLCWDGRFLWIASPEVSKQASARGAQDRYLAVIDPQSERIVKFTAEDGLPPMGPDIGSVAGITALGPGRVFVAGYFGRSWCGIATFSREEKIGLDVFFEAHEVWDPEKRDAGIPKGVAFPIESICTLNPPAGTDPALGQRVLLYRGQRAVRPPLLIDPEKRSVEVLSEHMTNSHHGPSSWVDAGGFYWETMPKGPHYLGEVYRIGFPDFRPELVNRAKPCGPFLMFEGRVYAWCLTQLYVAPDLRESFRILKGPAPSDPPDVEMIDAHIWLSHHYGIVLKGRSTLRSAEVRFH